MSELETNTVGTTGTGERLLLLVHGYGADEYDLAPLTSHIDPDGRFFTVCPRGPRSVMGYGAGWYERSDVGLIDPAGFLASVDAIDATIDRVCAERNLDRSRAVIIGFSQGGVMALASALRSPGAVRPAAVACLSGRLQEIEGLHYFFSGDAPTGAEAESDSQPDILIHHGTLDPVVPIENGHNTRDVFTANGVAHIYREYPMQHEINPQSVADLRDWLAER